MIQNLERAYTRLPDFTMASFSVTGGSTLITAPGAGLALTIYSIYASLLTTTTGRTEVSFAENTNGTSQFRVHTTTIGQCFSKEFSTPWLLDTNTLFQVRLSVTAASTPTVEVTVGYRILDRRR